jgi:hypothetical protein
MSHAEHHRVGVVGAVAVAIGLAFFSARTIDAHKAVTSPYTYNDQVFPIVRDKCGRCHIEGGPAPMSLLTYNGVGGGAYAWAQSMREMLVSQAMPPWYVDPTGPAVGHTRVLTSRELDILVTWASGGAPEGLARKLSPVPTEKRWALGKPDVVLQMPSAHEVAANVAEETFELDLRTNLAEARWVKAADLLPGMPTMVRRAVISVAGGAVLAVWEPGDDISTAPAGAAFLLPARAPIHVQIFYKKPWQDEQQADADRSSVGLYFASPPSSGAGISAVILNGPTAEGDEVVTFEGETSSRGRVLALRPQLDRPYSSLEVTAIPASGARIPLLKLHAARPEWPRRYWLVNPVELPAGTRIEVTASPGDPDSGPLLKLMSVPLQIAIDVETQ